MLFLQASGGNPIVSLLPLLLVFGVMYFFMIRPQQKRQKEQTAFMEGLEKGQDVVTASGIIGKINKIEGNIINLQIANNTFIRITKSSVSKEMTDAFAASNKEEK